MLDVDVDFQRNGWQLHLEAKLDEAAIGLFGRSGAGKTTVLHLVAGLLTPERGRIVLDGHVLFDGEKGINLPPEQRRIGIVFQDARLFPHYSVRRNLRYGQNLVPRGDRRFRFRDIVDLLELGELVNRRPQQLSGGERQRVALGRAILSSPRVLLMDEPLAALDRRLKLQILPFLQRVRDELGIPFIYISHDIAEILQLTDHLLILDAGRRIGIGHYRDLAQDHQVLDLVLPTGLVNILETTVVATDQAAGFIRLAPRGEQETPVKPLELRGPVSSVAVGERVSIAMRAEDITLATVPMPREQISVLNQFPGTIRRLVRHAGRAIIEIDVGIPLLVELSTGSCERLRLAEGTVVWCLIKANALQVVGAAHAET